MSVLRRMMRVSNRFLLVFIFIFSLSSSCLYFIYVAPGIGKHGGVRNVTSGDLEAEQTGLPAESVLFELLLRRVKQNAVGHGFAV
jgi:hypothetical protein